MHAGARGWNNPCRITPRAAHHPRPRRAAGELVRPGDDTGGAAALPSIELRHAR